MDGLLPAYPPHDEMAALRDEAEAHLRSSLRYALYASAVCVTGTTLASVLVYGDDVFMVLIMAGMFLFVPALASFRIAVNRRRLRQALNQGFGNGCAVHSDHATDTVEGATEFLRETKSVNFWAVLLQWVVPISLLAGLLR